jgi:hypothetical protein
LSSDEEDLEEWTRAFMKTTNKLSVGSLMMMMMMMTKVEEKKDSSFSAALNPHRWKYKKMKSDDSGK